MLAITFPNASLGVNFPSLRNAVGNVLIETAQGDINASAGGVVQFSLNGINNDAATVVLLAGKDINGNVISPGRNIDARSSGVIGSNVRLDASGNVTGLVFARKNLGIVGQNVNVTALAGGTATVSAVDTISGTIIAAAGINASRTSVDASLLSAATINTSGDSSGAQKGFGQGSAGDAANQVLANDADSKASASSEDTGDDEKKKGKQAVLAQKMSRVTVVLPPKNKS